MTVSNQTQFVNYVGNGAAAQAFAFAFRCVLSSYLTVEFRSASGAAVLALNVDYTVSLNPDQEANPGGTITMTDAVRAAPTAATTVALISAAPNVQQLDLPTGGAFPAASVEAQLDNLTQQIQQLRDALASALRARPGDALAPLPLATSRANTLQGYDAGGAPLLYAVSTSLGLVTQAQAPFGSAALPGYSFAGRVSDGMWSPAAQQLAWSTNGVERLRLTNDQMLGALGTAALPEYSFTGRTGDGMYSPAAGSLAWSVGGVQRLLLDANGIETPLGAAATPSHSFIGDSDTGAYSPGANTWAVATSGVQRLQVTSDGRIFGTALHNNAGSVTGTTNQYVASGTYVPTVAGNLNISSTGPVAVSAWTRVGNVVTTSVGINITVTSTAAGVLTSLTCSLPIATGAAAGLLGAGAGATDAAGGSGVRAYILGGATQVSLDFFTRGGGTTTGFVTATFTYVIT